MAAEPVLNVLVIDDQESHASLVSRVVRKNGYNVETAHSAEDAIAKFDDGGFDLVITDIFMSGMGGIAGIDRMRALDPDLMVIAMSAGYSDMSARAALEAAREVGADAVLPKPFALAELRLAVARLLEERGNA